MPHKIKFICYTPISRESQLSISMQLVNFAAEKNPETRKSLWMLLFSYFFGI